MTDETTGSHALRISRRIRATRERLFAAWTDPAELQHWWRMEEPGWSFAGAELDLRIGGAYRLGMTAPDGCTHVAVGVYREIDPPARLVFTWDWDDPSHRVGATLVSVDLIDAGRGFTDVVITHVRFGQARHATTHERGWGQLLQLLDHHLTENPS